MHAIILIFITFILFTILKLFSKRCTVCGAPIKRTYYTWRLDGKKEIMCPRCNGHMERKISKQRFTNFIVNLFFLYISYYAVTYFFSTYIYQLPTHQCPFCMLQIEYNFIGYFIWSSLFLGLFFSICTYIFSKFKAVNIDKFYKLSLIFNLVFVSLVSFYVIRYYILKGVLL